MLIYLPSFILSIQNICKLMFIFTPVLLRGGRCGGSSIMTNHTTNVFVERVHGYVGVAFRHELTMIDKFLDTTAKNVKLDFLYECTTSTKLNWVNTSFKSKKREIYGFPLNGNKGIFSFCIQHSDRRPKRIVQKIQVNISELTETYLHEIRICTTLNEKRLGELVTRYQLVATLAKFLLNTDVFSVKIHNFNQGCIIFSFRFLQGCSNEIMKAIRAKLLDDGNAVSKELNKAVSNITQLTHVNMTESPTCIQAYKVTQHERAKWMSTVIPLLIFLFVIGLPVTIACYVCRGVRRRQNKMMQQRERALKEEETRLNDLKRLGGHNNNNNVERNMIPNNKRLEYTPPNKKKAQKNQQHQQHQQQHQQKSKIKKFFAGEEKKKMFVAKVFDDYVPHAIQERRDYERSEMNISRAISKHDPLFYPHTTSTKNENLLPNHSNTHIGSKATLEGGKPLQRMPPPQTNYKNSPIFPKYSTAVSSKQNYDDLSLTSQSTSQTIGSSHMSSMRKPNTTVAATSRRERVPSDQQKGSHTFRNPLLTISETTKNLKSVSFYDDDAYFPAPHSAPQTRCGSARGKNKQRASVYRQRSAPCIPVSNLHQNFDNHNLNPVARMNNPNNLKKIGGSFEHDGQNRRLLSNCDTTNNSVVNINTTDQNTTSQQPTKSTTDSTSSRRSIFDSVITIASTGKNLLSTSIKDISIKKTADIANKTFHDLLNRTQRSVPTSQTSQTDAIVNVDELQPTTLSEFSYQKYSSGTTTSSRIYFSDDLSDDVFIQTGPRKGGENERFFEGSDQLYSPNYSFDDRGPIFNPETPLLNDNSFDFQGNPSSYPNSIYNERQQFVPPNFGKQPRMFKPGGLDDEPLRVGGHHNSRRFRNDHEPRHGYRKPPHAGSSTHRNKKDLIYPFKVDDNLSIPYLGSKKYFYKNRDKDNNNPRPQTLDSSNRMGAHSYFHKPRYQSCSLEDISPGGLPTLESANIPNTDFLQRKFNPNSFRSTQQQQQQQRQQQQSSFQDAKALDDSNGIDTDLSDVIGSSTSSIGVKNVDHNQQFFPNYHHDSSDKENYNVSQHISYTSAIQRGNSLPLPLPNHPQGVEFKSYSSHEPSMNAYSPYQRRNISLHQSLSLEDTYPLNQDNTAVRYSPESNRIHILPTTMQVDNNSIPTTPIVKNFTEAGFNNLTVDNHHPSITVANQQKTLSSNNNSATQQLRNFGTTAMNSRSQRPISEQHRIRSKDSHHSEDTCIDGARSFQDNMSCENQRLRADSKQQQALLFDKHQETLKKEQTSRETSGRVSSPVQIVPSFEKVVSDLNNEEMIQKPVISNAARKRSLFRLHKENTSGRIDSFEKQQQQQQQQQLLLQQQESSQSKIPRFTHSNNSSFAVCKRNDESSNNQNNIQQLRNNHQHQHQQQQQQQHNIIANTNYLQPPHFFPDDATNPDGNHHHPDRKFAQSFESNSSVVTYMDLGSEYEVHPESTSQALSPNTGHDNNTSSTMNNSEQQQQQQQTPSSVQHISNIISDTYHVPYETNSNPSMIHTPSMRLVDNQKLVSPPSSIFYQSNARRDHERYSDSNRDEEEFV